VASDVFGQDVRFVFKTTAWIGLNDGDYSQPGRANETISTERQPSIAAQEIA